MTVSITQLYEAKTFGDLFALDFPYVVGRLKNVDAFSNCVNPLELEYVHEDLEKIEECSGEQRADAGQRIPRHLRIGNRAFLEPVSMIVDHEEKTSDNNISENWHLYVQGFRFQSGRGATTTALHVDRLKPRERLYLCPNNKPTFVVPHQAMLEILSASEISGLLNAQLNDHESINEISRYIGVDDYKGSNIRKRFRKAAIQIEPNTVTVALSMTPHHRDQGLDTTRVFLRAYAYE